MSKASTLERVITDISHKDLGTARERLLGLLREYPNDLGLRHILGRIYLELQFPQEAGRYLYLVDDQSEIVQNAIRKYERFKKSSAEDVLKGLRVRGYIGSIKDEYARNRLHPLFIKCGIKNLRFPEPKSTQGRWAGDGTGMAGGCIIAAILIFLLGSGVWALGKILIWIVELIAQLF